jgi:3-hydroxyisobutyrate dehydrogenase-like beta-hydroxyacid dehydrogenase
MTGTNLGILHPGLMGISIAASAKNSGCTVYWASQGRGEATRARAAEQDLVDAGTLGDLCAACEVIICVCPPHAAEEVAGEVLLNDFKGVYIDANAISVERTKRIAARLELGGIKFVDGGIIGGPAWKTGTTWLYLSGEGAKTAASFFSAGPLEVKALDGPIGQAAALKMCYAAYTKGRRALLTAILGAAEVMGVTEELYFQWRRMDPDMPEKETHGARAVTSRAWRFAGEMEEIAATLEGAGVPGGFHLAAAELYRRLAHFKDAPELPELPEVLAAVVKVNL